MCHISVIIPCHNEENTIEDVIKGIKEVNSKYQIILVNDGSTDSTNEIIKKQDITIVNHKKNQGYGAALISGINESFKNKSEIVVFFDADGQHNPKEIPNIIKPVTKCDASMVMGSRFLNENNIPILKKLGIMFVNSYFKLITKENIAKFYFYI